jgi:hypothetical protein
LIALQHIDFLCIAHWTQQHIIMDRMGPLTSDFSSVGHRYQLYQMTLSFIFHWCYQSILKILLFLIDSIN